MFVRALACASVGMVLGLVGCGPKPEPTSPAPAEPAVAEVPQEPETPWSQCQEGFAATGDPEADLTTLARACALKLGQRPLTPVRVGIQAEADAVDRFTFTAGPGGRCYRVIATGESGVRDVDVQVLGANGRVLASDTSHAGWAIIPEREPMCLDAPEVVAVEVSIYRGSGKYALQVWTGDKR